MNKAETYKGFEISWQQPPQTSAKWEANVGSSSPQLYALMGRHGAQVIDGRTCDEMIANAKRYINGLVA